MPTFGFSAFLKLLSLNDRPHRTEIRNRLRPTGGGGYDFHRSMRLRSRRYLIDGDAIEDVLASCGEIARASEQHSARVGLRSLADWRDEHPGPTLRYEPALFQDPNLSFKVHFTPDFGLRIGGRRTAVHIWNTARPLLVPRMVYAALSLFPELYAEATEQPDDLAVLSLREHRLYALSDAFEGTALLGRRIVTALDTAIRDIRDDLGIPPLTPGQHPPQP